MLQIRRQKCESILYFLYLQPVHVLLLKLKSVYCFSLTGTFPIDTTKTRLQIQGQKIDARFTDLKYRGMSHAFFRILREEGAIALYSGYVTCTVSELQFEK